MVLDYDLLMSLPPVTTRRSYSERDTIVYAIGVGAAIEAGDRRYVYESGLEALPTMAVVLAAPDPWLRGPEYGIDWSRLLHGEQSLVLHRPLPVAADVTGVTTIDAIYDKGADKGAVLRSTRTIADTATGEPIATVGMSLFLRGQGGFGGGSEGAPKPHCVPADRPPDHCIDLATRPEQALLYRLSGDRNPLHVDPAAARAAGFPTPILHGLCTYGFAARGAVRALSENGPVELRRFDARFSSPVFPGETIRVELWREGRGRAALRASAAERGAVVLENGLVEYHV